MTKHSDATDDTTQNHPAADLETVVIDPDDVVEMIRRNNRDRNESRSHSLRVSPPLKGEKRATPHVSDDHAMYPPDMDPKPIHLNERSILADDTGKVPRACQYPSLNDSRSEFRTEYDLGPESDVMDHEQWDEWWQLELEVWEDSVREHLNARDEIELGRLSPIGETTTVSLRYERSDDE